MAVNVTLLRLLLLVTFWSWSNLGVPVLANNHCPTCVFNIHGDSIVSSIRGNWTLDLTTCPSTFSCVLPYLTNSISMSLVHLQPSGHFRIVGPKDFGIMVVAQSLHLRVRDGRCRDYLKFTAGNNTSYVCGHVMKWSNQYSLESLIGNRTFISYSNQVDVYLHTDATKKSDAQWNEINTIELVVTAFKDCSKQSFVKKVFKWWSNKGLKSCSPSDDKVCVSDKVFCDGVMNCGWKRPLGYIGFDEENCKIDESTVLVTTTEPPQEAKESFPAKSSGGINPLYVIIIFLAIILILFGFCTFMASANEKKFSDTIDRFATMTLRNSRRGRRSNASGSHLTAHETQRPTAPPADELGPPDYQDLFPPSSAPNL